VEGYAIPSLHEWNGDLMSGICRRRAALQLWEHDNSTWAEDNIMWHPVFEVEHDAELT
jgi:hypothetical protein